MVWLYYEYGIVLLVVVEQTPFVRGAQRCGQEILFGCILSSHVWYDAAML